MKKFRIGKLELTSDAANRSGLQTINMNSTTPDTVVGTTFKNVLVDETGEFVVSSAPVGAITEVYRGTTAPATPSTGWLWVDTSNALNVQKQRDGAARVEVKPLQYDNTLFVDLGYGSNTTGLRERFDRPFATVAAAVTASLPGDTIVLRNGTYAIGNITTVHNLNFQAEAGVVVVSGSLIVNSNNTVTWTGGIYNGTAATNEFFTIGDGTIYFDFESITTAGKRFVRNANQVTLSPKVYGRAKTVDNSAFGITYELLVNFNAILGAGLTTFNNPIVDLQVGRVKGLGLFNLTGIANNPKIDITFDTADYEGGLVNSRLFQLDCSNSLNSITNPQFHIKGNRIDGPKDATSSLAMCYLNGASIGNMLNTKGTIDVKYYDSATQLIVDNNGANSEIHINGDNHYSSNRSLYVMYQANGTGAPVTKSSTLYNHTRISEVNGTGIAGRAATTTPGTVFIVAQGASYICDSLENKSLQYLVGGVDNQAVAGINNNYTDTYIKFYGTKLSANNTLVGSVGLMYNDIGVAANNHGIIQYEFHNGCQFEFLGNAVELISGGNNAGATISRVVYTDDFTTNKEFNYGTSIEAVEYRNNLTSIIPAGTYTVKDSEKDLYCDVASGIYNVVLPAANKFVNREISVKATSLHPTNTITISTAGGLIDGSATYVVPNTSTIRVNTVLKSDGTGRWIK